MMVDTTAIRQSVIDQAIEGKLFNDLSSSISTTLNSSINSDDAWCEIPENWMWICLDDITDSEYLNDGDWVLKKDMVEDGPVKLIQLGSVGKCFFKDKDHKKLTLERFHELNGTQIYPGYLLINRLVTKGMHSCILPEIDGVLMTAVDICWIRPNEEKYNIKYLMYAIASRGMQAMVNQLGRGVTRFRISKKNLIKIPIPYPPLDIQNKIVDKIDEIFAICDLIDELQFAYTYDREALKSKIIDAGIQGKLTEQFPEDGNAEDLYAAIQKEKRKIYIDRKARKDNKIKPVESDTPFAIPDNWRWIRFGDVGLFKKGPFGSALTKSMFVPKGDNSVKVYEQQHAIKKDDSLGTYYIAKEYFDEKMQGFEVLPGDIIVSCAGTIGETYIMPENIEQGIINQALMRVTLPSGINKKFFQYYFDSNLKKSAQEESNGSAIKNIPPFDVLKNWYFPLVPYKEQLRIVNKIDSILATLD